MLSAEPGDIDRLSDFWSRDIPGRFGLAWLDHLDSTVEFVLHVRRIH